MTRYADRLWLIGGLLLAALLVTVTYLFLISPQNEQTSSLQDQADTADLKVVTLQQRLIELRKQRSSMPQYQAELERNRAALPSISGLPDFLRQLQSAGNASNVAVNSVIVGAPAEVPGMGARIYSLPLTVIAAAPAARLEKFLDQIQQVQPRAILISGANALADDQSASFAGTVTLTLNLQAFLVPELSASASPTPTATR
jgi:type IV pilus assembly protein PilO